MINLQQLIDKEMKKGYSGDSASAKVCQDIVLKAISESTLKRNVTVKGGVVMRSKTNNIRRATQDMDIDFIRYSLADEAIDIFIEKLNCLDGILIERTGDITELKQQDYHGKRVFVTISDTSGNHLRSKIDLGVHKRLEIEQEEYCFDIAYDDEGASLLINTNEQMFSEKLRSLLKFGVFSTRYKDVFDMYYLKEHIEKTKMLNSLEIYIFNDDGMRENNITDIIMRLQRIFSDKRYKQTLDRSDKRWIDEDIDTILNGLLDFIRKI